MLILNNRILLIASSIAECGLQIADWGRKAGPDWRVRLYQLRRTEVAKPVRKWGKNLQFVRLCPRLPALSAFARLFWGGEKPGRRVGHVGVSGRNESRFGDKGGGNAAFRRLAPLKAAWRRLAVAAAGGFSARHTWANG